MARPFTRVTAVLLATLAICLAGAASAGAIDLAGVHVPGTAGVQLPHVPSVKLPTPALPGPAGGAVNTVNGVTGNAADTVNGAVDSLNGTVGNAGGAVGGSGGGSSGSGSGGGGGSSGAASGGAGGLPSSGSGGGGASVIGGGGQQGAGNGGGGGAGLRRVSGGSTSAARRARAKRAAAARRGRPGGTKLLGARVRSGGPGGSGPAEEAGGNPVSRVINRIERVIPGPIKALIVVLALLALGFAIRSRVMSVRARRLESHRQELLGDVGLLQRALLPEVPDGLRGIDVSVAYRPAEGPAAGGDFYDVFELDRGRTAIIVGDVCGHGRAALAVTALMRYTLRAYLGAGFEPRVALQVAARSLDGDPEGALTTVVLAVYDPDAGTLTYACAGHEPPIVLGPAGYEPVTAFSAPPLGGFMLTGQRQTTVALPQESSVCFFTDGLVEARLGDDMIGRGRLSAALGDLAPDAGAQLLLERIAAQSGRAPDDMAACLVRVRSGAPAGPAGRVEELAADDHDLAGERVYDFLAACGVDPEAAVDSMRAARARAAEFGGALLRVALGDGAAPPRVEVAPRETAALPVPLLDEAGRKAAALAVPAGL